MASYRRCVVVGQTATGATAIFSASGNQGHPAEISWIETALEEYKSLRSEALSSMGSQHTILGFGTATLGLIIGPGLALHEGSTMTFSLIFALFVPLFSATVLMIWWGEVMRMMRAGNAIACLEKEINKVGGWSRPALSWESNLRATPNLRHTRFVMNIGAVFAAFSLIAVIAIAIAIVNDYEVGGGLRMSSMLFVAISLLIGGFVALSAMMRWNANESEWSRLNESLARFRDTWKESPTDRREVPVPQMKS
jgi:hypothetical protein